jgi:hypothetical protein
VLTVPNPTCIYHITDVSNLDSILGAGGVLSKNQMSRTDIGFTDIAYQSLQDRRSKTLVRCGPGGTLHDYAPFFFAPRPPMLFTIGKGNVSGRNQSSILYVVSSAQAVADAGQGFVFTDGHAIMAVTHFFSDLADLGKVDWKVMTSKMWNDTQKEPDRKRRRQAEFLVHDAYPFDLTSET